MIGLRAKKERLNKQFNYASKDWLTSSWEKDKLVEYTGKYCNLSVLTFEAKRR